jgi:MoaA/NifB/PqqE/SkfB family radical SAM enzyme
MSLKKIETEKYRITFDTETGREITEGINGYDDPFYLEVPSLIDIGIMGHCSNNCEYCYQGDHYQENMSVKDFEFLIVNIKDHVNQVALGGRGDPNKHEKFGDIISICLDNGVIPNYTTSGVGITESEIDISKKCGAVAVSFHRKDYTYRALKMLMDANIKTNIHYVLNKTTVFESYNFLIGNTANYDNYVDFKKLHAIIFLLFKKQGRAKNLNQSFDKNNDPDLKRFLELFVSEKANIFRKYNDKKYFIGCDSCTINKLFQYDNISLTKEQLISIDCCEGSRMSCYITPDLKLMPCSFGDHSQAISIRESSIRDIWNKSNLFLQFRSKLEKNSCECPYEF